MHRWLSGILVWLGRVWSGPDELGRAWLGRARRGSTDLGTATAEYAIATLAACGFAGLLLVILRSGAVRGLLLGIVRRALSVG
jgi:hypothetical protein